MASKPPSLDDIAALRERFPEAITDVRESLGEVTCDVDPASIVEVCRFLRDDPRFAMNMLADLCGVDLGIDQEPRFEVVYHLASLELDPRNGIERLRTRAEGRRVRRCSRKDPQHRRLIKTDQPGN